MLHVIHQWFYDDALPSVVALLGLNDDDLANRVAFTVMMVVAHSAPVVLGFVFFTCLEALPWFDTYKIQPTQHVNQLAGWLRRWLSVRRTAVLIKTPPHASAVQKTSASVYVKCLIDNLINHVLIVPLMIWFPVYLASQYLAPEVAVNVGQPLPPFWTCVVPQLAWYIVVEDALFYWTHRFLHWKPLYPYLHKKHHEFKSPITIAAEYAHPVEKFLGNQVPVMTGPAIWPTHPCVLAMWLCLRMCKTVEAHSGYLLPWSPFSCFPSIQTTSAKHDFHHSHNVGCFGSFFRFWDWACNTEGMSERKPCGDERRGN